MPIQPRRRNRLRKHNPYRHKNRRAPRRERHRHLDARPFFILIPAAKTQPALRQILANRHFFRESAPPNARQNARLHPRPISPRKHALFAIATAPISWKIPAAPRSRSTANRNACKLAPRTSAPQTISLPARSNTRLRAAGKNCTPSAAAPAPPEHSGE